MKRRKQTKYVHEARYVAEVAIVLGEDESTWSPYLCLEDTYKLADIRDALRQGDLALASRYGRIYGLRPVEN